MADDSTIASGLSGSSSVLSNLKARNTDRNAMKKMLGVQSPIEDPSKQKKPLLFRGFIGGAMFKTKKGYQGQRVDTLWVRQIFASFEHDDTEIIDVAMESSLADPNAQVTGGWYGAVFSIGDYGFNAQSQFDIQRDILAENERKVSKGIEYLTNDEWNVVDVNLGKIASHGKPIMEKAVRGDTLAALAVRNSAFHVAKKLIEYGVDPLLVNEDGHDVFLLLKVQYEHLTRALSKVNEDKERASHHVVLPSEMIELNTREEKIMHQLDAQMQFISVFKEVLEDRVETIKDDKIRMQRLKITRKPIPPELIWNVEQGDRAQAHIDESSALYGYVHQRIEIQKEYNKNHVNLADLVHQQHASFHMDDNNTLVDEEKAALQAKLEATIHQKRGVREAKARLAAMAPTDDGDDSEYELIEEHSDDDSMTNSASGAGTLTQGSILSMKSSMTSRFKKVKKQSKAGSNLPGIQGVMSDKVHHDGSTEQILYR